MFLRARLKARRVVLYANLRFASLEDRQVPSTFTVLNSNDTGAGSPRQAVADANANIGPDTIGFADGSGSGGTNFLDATTTTRRRRRLSPSPSTRRVRP
ncbi:MAG TPA: hypothetical protein VHR66_02210 [Gemmataceae bacterium]|nr:hypothetical protein [Gemmataceae bacterium]